MKIKKGDTVKIMTGKDKGKTGRIIKVLTSKDRVVVEGLNLINKHERPTQDNPQGGIVQKEASIHHSNVMFFVNISSSKLRKIRYSKKSGGNIN